VWEGAAAVMAESPPPCGVLPFATSGKKTRRTEHLRRGYVVQGGKELPHSAASPWLRGAEWNERGDIAKLPRCHTIIFREKYSHTARLD